MLVRSAEGRVSRWAGSLTGNQLNLAVSEAALKVINVTMDDTFLDAFALAWVVWYTVGRVIRDRDDLWIVLLKDTHDV